MSNISWNSPDAFELVRPVKAELPHKTLAAKAKRASALHSRIGDWIEAAPILTVALHERHYQGLFDLARAHGKVVDAMRVVGLPTVMRRQSVEETIAWHKASGWLAPFRATPESTLAQLLAANRLDARRAWLARLSWATKLTPASIDASDWLCWATRMAAVRDEECDGYRSAIDLIRNGEPFDLSWSLRRFHREHEAWVERMRAEWAAARDEAYARRVARSAVDRERVLKELGREIDYGPLPETGLLLGAIEYRALRTQRALMDEGGAMRHCVGGEAFRKALKKQTARFFHLQCGSVRSTLEIIRAPRGWMLGQHCGPCNQRPSTAFQEAARELLSLMQAAEAEAAR